MSARSRGRANPNQDADEERRLWKEIKDKASEVDSMFVSGPSPNHELSTSALLLIKQSTSAVLARDEAVLTAVGPLK